METQASIPSTPRMAMPIRQDWTDCARAAVTPSPGRFGAFCRCITNLTHLFDSTVLSTNKVIFQTLSSFCFSLYFRLLGLFVSYIDRKSPDVGRKRNSTATPEPSDAPHQHGSPTLLRPNAFRPPRILSRQRPESGQPQIRPHHPPIQRYLRQQWPRRQHRWRRFRRKWKRLHTLNGGSGSYHCRGSRSGHIRK